MKATIIIENKTYTEWPDLVRNDWGFPITFNVKYNDNSTFNLSGFDVRFKTKKVIPSNQYNPDQNTIDGVCSITNYTSGIAVYTVQSSDLVVSGKFETEVECSSTSAIYTAKLGYLNVVEDLPN